MNILHVAMDEKFIPFVSARFCELPGVTNRFLIHGTRKRPLRYVADVPGVRVVGMGYPWSRAGGEDLAWADLLVIHCLTPFGAALARRIPRKVVVLWGAWGMDYAPLLPGGEEGHMEAETLSVCTGLLRHGRMPWWQRLRRHLIRRLVLLPGIARCDLFSAPVPEEFAVLRAAIPGYLRAAYAQIDYASVEHSFAPGSCSVRGCDILVGNSATPSNNHLDAFRLLAACPLAGRRVLVPLSYGDSQYREVVLRQGHSLFGSAFEPILDFMPLASYNERLSTCGVAIMYHRRQQALGNVGSLLFGGCKVLFHPESPVLATLRRDGAVVDSTEQLRSDPHAALMPLDADAVACNQAVIKSRWGAAVVAEHLRELILAVRHIQEARCTASRI